MSVRVAKVGALAAQIRGVTYSKAEASSAARPGYSPILRAGNITDAGLVYDGLVFVPNRCISQKQRLRLGDIVIAASSGSLDVVGKAARVVTEFDGGFGAFCKVLRPGPEVDPAYLANYFATPEYRARISHVAAGANINNIRSEHLDDLLIPLPSVPEQRRIAAILDKADELRAKRRAVLLQLDNLTRSIFLDMFGDPVANPRRFPTLELSGFGTVVTGNTPPRANAQYYGGRLEWIKSDNLSTGSYYAQPAAETLSEAGRKVVRLAPAGSILVTCIAGSRESIGNAAMLDREAAFNQQINALIPRTANPHFLFAQFRVAKCLIQAASTDSMKGMVSKSKFEAIRFINPPGARQDEFAATALALQRLKLSGTEASDVTDDLFASLQHRAFRGEL